MEIRISVRTLVEFIMRSGNIDNRIRTGSDTAMIEGGKIHRMIQKQMGSEYKAEVSLVYPCTFDDYILIIEGRADGIITEKDGVTIDEIKSTAREGKYIKQPVETHLAQAKVYAAIYAIQNDLEKINVRMTYFSTTTEEIKYFNSSYTGIEIKAWFTSLINSYKRWSDFTAKWSSVKNDSIHGIEFPYPYREGQKELAAGVYRTIIHEKKLFLEAPTGTGKTITTVFPTVKAIGEAKADKLFYLTAKTITRTVAEETFDLLRTAQGLKFKTVTLTARDKICFLEKSDCNPAACPYAKGHYDRINDAMYDMLMNEDSFDRDKIQKYALKHEVCPFEMSLDMSLFSDGIICDYNYVFDPFVYLRRFFGDGVKGKFIFLIDEAHNLVDRGRDMYSASLIMEDFAQQIDDIREFQTGLVSYVAACLKELQILREGCGGCTILKKIEPLADKLSRLSSRMSEFLDDHADNPAHDSVLDFYFKISRFLTIYDLLGENYVIYDEFEQDGSFMLKLFCVNPAQNLQNCFARGCSAILFSATLLPVQYYKKLLGGSAQDFEMYAKSVFDPDNLKIVIGSDCTSRYSDRSEKEYMKIAKYIHEITLAKRGNYMVFFPSHAFLDEVNKAYSLCFGDESDEKIIIQRSDMTEEEKEDFLDSFTGGNDIDLSNVINMDVEIEENRSLIGFCVMGGIFSEGIDLKSDRLIGVIVVGTGLPQVSNEREILKLYFDASENGNGFEYSYRYPGMNKVLQAAGRTIRTETDRGIVALLDSRFLQTGYRQLFPREWTDIKQAFTNSVNNEIEAFWRGISE